MTTKWGSWIPKKILGGQLAKLEKFFRLVNNIVSMSIACFHNCTMVTYDGNI